jgi:hypothetical protein
MTILHTYVVRCCNTSRCERERLKPNEAAIVWEPEMSEEQSAASRAVTAFKTMIWINASQVTKTLGAHLRCEKRESLLHRQVSEIDEMRTRYLQQARVCTRPTNVMLENWWTRETIIFMLRSLIDSFQENIDSWTGSDRTIAIEDEGMRSGSYKYRTGTRRRL